MAESSTIPLPQLRLNSNPGEVWLIFKQQFSDYKLICGIDAKGKPFQAFNCCTTYLDVLYIYIITKYMYKYVEKKL